MNTNTTLTTLFAAVAIPAALLIGGIAFLHESSADAARKPEAIERILQDSLNRCDSQPVYSQNLPYEARLREALSSAYTSDLDALQANGVTVCLDQRLSRQDAGFFDNYAYAMFYNRGGQKVLGLWDNGLGNKDGGLFQAVPRDYAHHAIGTLDRQEINGLFAGNHALGVLARYSRPCGKGCTTTGYEWRDAESWWSGFSSTLQKNNHLTAPPLKDLPWNKAPA